MAPGTTRHVHPGPRALGDAVMLAHGVYAPLDRFVCKHEGRRIRDRGQLLDGAAFPVAVTLVLPSSQVGPDPVEETLVLIDAEGTPVAEVCVDSAWVAGEGHVAVSGRVRAHADAGQDIPGLAHSPAHVRALMGGRDALGVLVDRPLLASEVRLLSGIGQRSPVLLLIRSVDPGVPVDVLVDATRAVAKQIPPSLLSPPSRSRGGTTPRTTRSSARSSCATSGCGRLGWPSCARNGCPS